MTDPTTAILDLVRGRGPMTRESLNPQNWHWNDHFIAAAIASGALREVEWRETCAPCEGKGRVWLISPGACYSAKCPTCDGSGTVPVTYIATPEVAAILDVLREGPRTWTEVRKRALSTGSRGVTARGALEAIDTLLTANWITRTEQERECGTCGGSGDGGEGMSGFCPACKDGRVAVAVYELISTPGEPVDRHLAKPDEALAEMDELLDGETK